MRLRLEYEVQTNRTENGTMPTKHIAVETWESVTETTIKATIKNKRVIKEGQVLDYLIRKATKNLTNKDFLEIAKTMTDSEPKQAKTAKKRRTTR